MTCELHIGILLSSVTVSIEEEVQYVTADNNSDYSESSDEEFSSSISSEKAESDETKPGEESDKKGTETKEKEEYQP